MIEEYLKKVYDLSDIDVFRKYMDIHDANNTDIKIYDYKDNLIGYIRWNMEGTVAHVLDFVVDKEKIGGISLIRELAREGLLKHPEITHIKFARRFREDKDNYRLYPIEKFLRMGD